MHKTLPLLLLLLAVVLGVWLFLGREELRAPEYGLGFEEGSEPAEAAGPVSGAGLGAAGLEGTTSRPRARRREPAPYVDPRSLPRGSVIVHPLGPDLEPLEGADLRVYVEPAGRGGRPGKLGRYDKAQRTWRFENVIAGAVRVHVFGDHVADTWQPARVRAGRENHVTVHLDLAGAIHYVVTLYDKTQPKTVELTLLDFQEKPTPAWYQSRSSRHLSSPVHALKATLAPEGVVYGLAPGHYRLRAVSPNEEWDDAELDIRAGQTQVVKFEIRR